MHAIWQSPCVWYFATSHRSIHMSLRTQPSSQKHPRKCLKFAPFCCTEWLHVKVSCIRGQHEPSRKITRQVPELEIFTSHFWPVNRSEIWVSHDKAELSILSVVNMTSLLQTKCHQTLPWGDYSVQKRWPMVKGVHILNSQSSSTFVVPRVLY